MRFAPQSPRAGLRTGARLKARAEVFAGRELHSHTCRLRSEGKAAAWKGASYPQPSPAGLGTRFRFSGAVLGLNSLNEEAVKKESEEREGGEIVGALPNLGPGNMCN